MQEITGTLNAVEEGEDKFLPVSDHDAFFNGATGLHEGIDALSTLEPPTAVLALSFLCGQAAECYLKAVLSHAGSTTKELERLGHDLLALWTDGASKTDLSPAHHPLWLQHLAGVHKSPSPSARYPLRYPMGLHAILLPHPRSIAEGLDYLRSFAKAKLGR